MIINSGTLAIPADAGFAIMDWTGGTINGALNVASNGVLNVGYGPENKILDGTLTNAGTVVVTVGYGGPGNNLYLGRLYNLAGGLFDIQNDTWLVPYNGPAFFNNAGTMRKSGGTGTTDIDVEFTNTGIVETDSGTLRFRGEYSNSSSANLALSLGGPAPGSGYGRINFSNPVTFDGTFVVSTRNGYLPNPGITFQVLSYPSSTNSFTCLSGLDLGGGILLQPQFSSTDLTLLATAYTTNASQPQLFINPTLGGVAITWPVGFPNWTLQSTTNLSSPAWVAVSNVCANQARVPINAAQRYFRLKPL